jgi:hypothetical protein
MLTTAKPRRHWWSTASSSPWSRKSGSRASSSTPALLTTPSAERVRVAVGAEVPIEFTQRPQDDPQVRRPDISLDRLELGWEPKVPLDTGLERMVAWVSEAWTT